MQADEDSSLVIIYFIHVTFKYDCVLLLQGDIKC